MLRALLPSVHFGTAEGQAFLSELRMRLRLRVRCPSLLCGPGGLCRSGPGLLRRPGLLRVVLRVVLPSVHP